MTGLRRIDQHLAEKARRIVQKVPLTKQWRTRLRRLPAQLRGAGLAATYADLMAQGEKGDGDLPKAYKNLAQEIATHVLETQLLPTMKSAKEADFLAALSQTDLSRYTRVCAEVEALAIWMSRLADALYKPEATTDGE